MTSTRPYLLRAIYDWIVDNDLTPHLLVEIGDERIRVPSEYVENGVIVLNTSPGAVRDLELGNEFVSFSARFGGTPHSIVVPIGSVQAIYARENGQGMFLGDGDRGAAHRAAPDDQGTPADEQSGSKQRTPAEEKPGSPQRAPHLTIVK